MTTLINQFGGATPLEQLPAPFRACLQNPDGLGCDNIVGSRLSGIGYCAGAFATQPYCGCVNNIIPCPQIAAQACANSPLAYRPTAMRPGGTVYDTCKSQPICVNIASVGGAQNLVSGFSQQCGGVVQNMVADSGYSPGMWALLMLFVVLVMLIGIQQYGAGGAPPGAEQGPAVGGTGAGL